MQAALADARRHEHTVKALSWELDNLRKLKDDSVAELSQQNAKLKHQLKVVTCAQEGDTLEAGLSKPSCMHVEAGFSVVARARKRLGQLAP